jgi:hypothetical protein
MEEEKKKTMNEWMQDQKRFYPEQGETKKDSFWKRIKRLFKRK